MWYESSWFQGPFSRFYTRFLFYNLHGLISNSATSRLFNRVDLKPLVTWFIVENSRLVNITGSLSRQVRGLQQNPKKPQHTLPLRTKPREEEIGLLLRSLSSLASKLADGRGVTHLRLQLITYQHSVTAASITFRQQNSHPLHVLFTSFMLAGMESRTSTRGAAPSQRWQQQTWWLRRRQWSERDRNRGNIVGD